VPVRSGSFAAIDCLKPIVTGSLLTGPPYLRSVVAAPTGANAPPLAFACSACASA
jgi:hypothetical protein